MWNFGIFLYILICVDPPFVVPGSFLSRLSQAWLGPGSMCLPWPCAWEPAGSLLRAPPPWTVCLPPSIHCSHHIYTTQDKSFTNPHSMPYPYPYPQPYPHPKPSQAFTSLYYLSMCYHCHALGALSAVRFDVP